MKFFIFVVLIILLGFTQCEHTKSNPCQVFLHQRQVIIYEGLSKNTMDAKIVILNRIDSMIGVYCNCDGSVKTKN